MNIAFCAQHSYWGGLGNNGGSRTIILSCETLRNLGHCADIVTHSDKYTWHKHLSPISHIPHNTDVCIACSVSDIEPMLAKMPKKAKAFWWCRLIENHQIPKAKIIKRAGMVRTLVNSESLQGWFKLYGVDTTVVYQGVDTAKWTDLGKHKPKTIGFLLSKKKRKNFPLVYSIIKHLDDSYEYVGYGASQDLDTTIKSIVHKRFSKFYANPSHEQLIEIYNTAKYWVATSTKEGLHNPPIEAGLCGCILVCNGAMLGGTADYCIHNETGYVYLNDNVIDVIKNIVLAKEYVVNPCKQLIRTKIQDRFQSMKHLVEVIND